MLIKTTTKAFLMVGLSLFLPTAFAQTTVSKGSTTASLFGNNINVVNRVSIAEGDIFVHDSADISQQQRGFGLTDGSGLWPNGLVPYQIAGDLTDEVLTTIENAIDHWNLASSVTLVERSTLGTDLPENYIDFVSGPGCASWVGMQGGSQDIWVANHCTTGSVIHEIGHALGLLHEHTRADRDQYIEVKQENIATGKEFNFDPVKGNTRDLGPYDYASIMHYGEYFFSRNGQATIVPIGAPEGTVIGQRVGLSDGDLAAIDSLYGTDLDIVVQGDVALDSQSTDLYVYVTNNGMMGAHDVQISIPQSLELLTYNSDGAWVCNQGTNTVDCTVRTLNSGATSNLILSFNGQNETTGIETTVSSKTHDIDLINNQTGVSKESERGFDYALGSDDDTLTSSGGGGSAGIALLGLLGFSVSRRRTLKPA